MGVSTTTAARIAKGQAAGMLGGEQAILSYEEFPHFAMSRTYCVDSTVADSACSATAYLGGVKGNIGTIGVSAAVKYKECSGQQDTNNHVSSIMDWAREAGKATGLVTTNGIVDASPAGCFGHIAYRGWYNDADVRAAGADPEICDDLAEQFVRSTTGREMSVVMGGDRVHFFPTDVEDVEELGHYGYREDGVNLIEEWQVFNEFRGETYKYMTSGKELSEFEDYDIDHFLGLFSRKDMEYHLEQTEELDDPTLALMTEKALQILERKEGGYVVFIEAGLIDHGHHGNKAREALDETLQLDEAVTRALEIVDLNETLIVVTADHSQAMTINGYPDRGNDIFGFAGHGSDGLYYPTLLYGQGPGYKQPQANGDRYDISQDDMTDKEYRFVAAVPENSADHAGEDVAIYAVGPQAHLFRGIYQQNYIPHLLAYASCIGEGVKFCDQQVIKS